MLPWAPPGSDLAAYNAALTGMFEDIYGIVEPQGSPDDAGYAAGWSMLLDPAACPAQYLPYLAQFVGQSIPPGTDSTSARAIVSGEANFQTGTLAGVTAAAKLWLTGDQSVTVLERTAADGETADAYHFVVIVHASEVMDATALTGAVDGVRPVGVQWTLIQESSWIISGMESAYASVSALEAASPSISNLEGDVP